MLILNYQLKLFPMKLKSKWTRPFDVKGVSPLGYVEVWNKEKTSSFKVNGHNMKLYFYGPLHRVSIILLYPLP